jgi:hypothetical protein
VSEVTWTPNGGSAGPAVTIANGETKLIEGNDPDKFIVITRTSATDLTTSTVVSIIYVKPNVFGFDDVSTAEQTAGDDEYRCVAIENKNSATAKNITVELKQLGTQQVSDTTQLPGSAAGTIVTTGSFATWPLTGFCWISEADGTERELVYYESRTADTLTVPANGRGLGVTSAAAGANDDKVYSVPGIELAIEAPSSQPSGNFAQPADEDTPPSGPTFTSPVIAADVLSVGDLDQFETYGIWMHRITPAGASSQVDAEQAIIVKADAA